MNGSTSAAIASPARWTTSGTAGPDPGNLAIPKYACFEPPTSTLSTASLPVAGQTGQNVSVGASGVIQQSGHGSVPAREALDRKSPEPCSASATSISLAAAEPCLARQAGRSRLPTEGAGLRVALSARCGSERRSEPRPASRICASPDRSDSGRRRVPWFHENALLRVDGRDDDRADDAARPETGENQGPAGFGRETSGEMNAGPRTGLRRQVPCPRPNKSRAFGPGVTTTSRPTAWRDALVANSRFVASGRDATRIHSGTGIAGDAPRDCLCPDTGSAEPAGGVDVVTASINERQRGWRPARRRVRGGGLAGGRRRRSSGRSPKL